MPARRPAPEPMHCPRCPWSLDFTWVRHRNEQGVGAPGKPGSGRGVGRAKLWVGGRLQPPASLTLKSPVGSGHRHQFADTPAVVVVVVCLFIAHMYAECFSLVHSHLSNPGGEANTADEGLSPGLSLASLPSLMCLLSLPHPSAQAQGSLLPPSPGGTGTGGRAMRGPGCCSWCDVEKSPPGLAVSLCRATGSLATLGRSSAPLGVPHPPQNGHKLTYALPEGVVKIQ